MIDKDALAVEYTRQNIELNKLENTIVYSSLGYSNVTARDFDLVVSNIPAKAGEPVVKYLLENSVHYLTNGGTTAIVVIKALEPILDAIISRNPNIAVEQKKQRPGHTFFQYKFIEQPVSVALTQNDIYHHATSSFLLHDSAYAIESAYGLEEPEQFHCGLTLLLKALESQPLTKIDHCLVYNPLNGHLAVILWKLAKPRHIWLVDRDLLSLKYARKNLLINGGQQNNINLLHQVGVAPESQVKMDLILGLLREKEGPGAILLTLEQMSGTVKTGGIILIASSSTAITRIIERLNPSWRLKIIERKKMKGYSSLILKRQ